MVAMSRLAPVIFQASNTSCLLAIAGSYQQMVSSQSRVGLKPTFVRVEAMGYTVAGVT